MQPQQPQPNNYDFIMNPATPSRPPLLGGNALLKRLLIVLGGLFILAIIAAVLAQVLGGGSGGFNKTAMLGIAQDQTQIIHLATDGVDNSTTAANKNFSISAQLSITSQQTDFLKYTASHGLKPKAKALALKQNADVDTQLTSAKSSSTYDSTYSTVMKDALNTYKTDLTSAYDKADSQGKAILKANFDAANLLLTQLTQ